jgi:hypothetical protein
MQKQLTRRDPVVTGVYAIIKMKKEGKHISNELNELMGAIDSLMDKQLIQAGLLKGLGNDVYIYNKYLSSKNENPMFSITYNAIQNMDIMTDMINDLNDKILSIL